jgi:short-subunit dehydrogenase
MSTSKSVVLITGCGSGIGKALARAFHRAGHPVCATARRLETMADLQAQGIITLPLDVTDDGAISRVLQAMALQGLEVGVLVNNAGYGAMGPLMDVPASEWQRQFEVNVFAPMALARAVLPGMVVKGGGKIVNISSVSGVMPTPFAGAYCASKAAVNAMSDSLRMELAPLGIEVITVQPGGIQSAFGDNAANQVSLSPGSPFEAVREGVMARANESQSHAMSADVFAEQLVRQVMAPGCPPVVRLGEKSRLMPLLKTVLPVRLLDRVLSRRFQLDKLSARR